MQNESSNKSTSCTRCGQLIPLLTDFAPNTDKGLELVLSGGYGEFYDSIDGEQIVNLCHDCAHAFCVFVGIDATTFHSHKNPTTHGGEYGQEHIGRNKN